MAPEFQAPQAARFAAAVERFDAANAADPNRLEVDGRERPRELAYAEWLTEWVLRLAPNASEELRLAARCQHLCRWKVPRSSYPMTRAGYLKWREELKRFHAEKAGEILKGVGYAADQIQRVQELNLKKGFPQDPESRILEDALCLVFLERQLAELAKKTSEEKLVNALQKSWQKMSSAGRARALELEFPPAQRALIQKAFDVKGGQRS